MIKKSRVKVQLSEEKSCYIGGQNIAGVVIVEVPERKKMELHRLTLEILCDVKISIGDDYAIQDDRSRTKQLHHDIRYYTNYYELVSERLVLEPGTYEYPFNVPLPVNAPPTCEDDVSTLFYGGVYHAVLATAFKTPKWKLAKSELRSKVKFKYMPLQHVQNRDDGFIETETYKSIHPFKQTRGSSADGALACEVSIPSEGLRQDKPNRLGLKFTQQDGPQLELTLKSLMITIETKLVLKSGHSRRERVLFYTKLFQCNDFPPGLELNLNELLNSLELKTPLIPSFITSKLVRVNKLGIKATVNRNGPKGSETAELKKYYPVTVLSPYVAEGTIPSPLENSTDYNDAWFPNEKLKEKEYYFEEKEEVTTYSPATIHPAPPPPYEG